MEPAYPAGGTILGPDEIEGLIPTHITTRGELDRWEQDNINEALGWLERRRPKDILNEPFLKLLHKKMFGRVWKWAGQFRRTEKNIGVPWYRIPIDLKQLFDDAGYWIDKGTFSEDETAVRFHHRLVAIHLFANGNGRHGRLAADLLLENVLGGRAFTWGRAQLARPGCDRQQYIAALAAADRGEYAALIEFARS
ncbi:MAG: mobile mystery protein B [Sedimentisphaerales bacterium]|nr:mobile mystery protein B [Sedimentisphaerales bacterium]